MLGIAHSGLYRLPRPANDEELALLRRIDELFTRWPFLGSRRMTAMLRAEGPMINRKRVRRAASTCRLLVPVARKNSPLKLWVSVGGRRTPPLAV